MKLSLSAISTVNATFEEDVEAYAAAGFDAIGLWEFKLPPDDAANVAVLRAHGLAVSNCVPAVPSFLALAIPGMEGSPDPEERIDAICGSIATSGRLRAGVRGVSERTAWGPLARRRAARSSRRVCVERSGGARGRRAARPRADPPRPARDCGVRDSLADALALLDEAGVDEVGIMADTYNLAHEDDADVVAAAARFTGLHVADELPEPVAGVRALPEPGGRSAELVAALRDAGWSGTLDVEIFSTPDAFWSLPVDEAARRRLRGDRATVLSLAGRTPPPSRSTGSTTLWDFGDPAESERRFEALLAGRARAEHGGALLAETLTQLARAQGLQRRFDDASARSTRRRRRSVRRTTAVESASSSSGGVSRTPRVARVAALRRSSSAWELACAAGEEALAVDAAHMLGIVEPDEIGVAWNERAMELARSSPDPVARRWIGSLANNMGWARHAEGDDDGAIALFELSRDAFLADGRADRARIARWSIARCLRSRGDVEQALEEQGATARRAGGTRRGGRLRLRGDRRVPARAREE